MWIPQNRLHRLKITGHLLQAILTFITGCMALAILTEKREHDSRVQWFFALVRTSYSRTGHLADISQCFLTMPALMYQVSPTRGTKLQSTPNNP